MGRHVVSPTTTGNLPPTPQGSQVPKVLLQSLDRKVTTEDVQMAVLTRWDTYSAWRGHAFFGRARPRILRGLGRGKARFPRAFFLAPELLGRLPCRSALRRYGERLDVPQLSQERILIVVATARYDLPLLVEVADFTEGQRHFASGRLH
jgi:hypothetical protein